MTRGDDNEGLRTKLTSIRPRVLLIPVISVLVAIAALGYGAWHMKHRRDTRVISPPITMPSPKYGRGFQVLRPNLKDALMVVIDRPHDPSDIAPNRLERIHRRRTFEVSTNSRGMRGPEFVVPAPGYRILCVGDSVTFGWGGPYEESYPALLGEKLEVEVLNGGVPGMLPPAIARWTKDNARALDPDLVLFTRRPDRRSPDAVRGFVNEVLLTARDIAPIPLGVVLPPVSTFDIEGSRNYHEESGQIQALLGAIPVIDLTDAFRAALPLPGVILETANGRQRMVKLPERTVILEAAAPLEGLSPEIAAAFEKDPGIREPLFFDGGHPDTEGYALFASTVADWVRQQGWLKKDMQ